MFKHFQINCTFNKDNVNRQMINKSKGVNTSLSWQVALAWTGGVVLFILFGKFDESKVTVKPRYDT